MATDVLSDISRIWIYQSSRVLAYQDTLALSEYLTPFIQSWTAHDVRLRANYEILYDRFVVLMVDESLAGASGCSIDKSVHLMTEIGQKMNIDFFDRLTFAYLDPHDEVVTVTSSAFADLYAEGDINDDTLVFDNLVSTKAALYSDWKKPLKDSWHKNFV